MISPSKPMSAALSGSSQLTLERTHPAADKRSRASESVPVFSVSDAMKVAMFIPNPQKPAVALIAGPTASGKTALALRLAQTQNCVIINADSAQVYAGLPVLSAQPLPHEMASVPHKLFGYLASDQICSAARWAGDVKREIAAAHAVGALPVLVGGSGLYIRTLLDGIAPMPIINDAVRGAVRAMATADAWAALQFEDAQAAAALHPNDDHRIKRALEVVRSAGASVTQWRETKTGGIERKFTVQTLLLLPDRAWLYERCDARFLYMMDHGALDEVRALMVRGISGDAPILRSIGVSEISAMIEGRITRQEALNLGQIATRQYAKRQYTWFRNQSPKHWPRWAEEINNENIEKIVTLLQ